MLLACPPLLRCGVCGGPSLFAWRACRLEGKSAQVEEELVRLGERRATTSEGHRAVVLEMAREFEDTFIQHIESGEVSPPPPPG